MSDADHHTVDVSLVLADAICEVSSSRIESYDDREVSITLTEDGFEEYIRELGLERWDDEARNWLDGKRSVDTATDHSENGEKSEGSVDE